MCYDPVRGYVLLSGGATASGAGQQQDTWSWDGTSWTNRGNAPACFTSLAVHGATNRVFGFVPSGIAPNASLQAYEWDGSQWVAAGQLTNIWVNWSPSQSWLSRVTAAYDAARQELIVVPDQENTSVHAVAVFNGTSWSVRACTTPLPAPSYVISGHSPARNLA